MSDERYTVLVADKVSDMGLRPLLEDPAFEVVMGAGWQTDEPERFRQAVGRAHGLIVRSTTKVTREVVAWADVLKVVGRAGVGVDNIDVAAATERGIAVLNAPAGNTVSAAELTLALILAIARRVPMADRALRDGDWKGARAGGAELRGKVLGLVGAGRIGGEVARRARAFGMRVVGYDPYLNVDRAGEMGLERIELDELLATSDVVSLHVPLTDETEGMLGAAELASMKPTAFLVNAARGGVVDETALAEALEAGRIAGAALDVFAVEPLPDDSPLRRAPNLVLSPHLGASTVEAQELVAREIAVAVRCALVEGDMSRAINAPSVGGEALRRLRPLFDLGLRVGRLACSLAPSRMEAVEIRYAGALAEVLPPLRAHVLTGILGTILGHDQVNFVNAPHLAETRDIEVTSTHLPRRTDYAEFVEVAVRSEQGCVCVAGALLGDQHPRIVRIDDYHVDVTPRGSLLVLRNRDVPGVIGAVGTLLGSMGLNIAEYHQARLTAGGASLATVAVDGRVDRTLAGSLMELSEVERAWVVDLG